MRLKPSPARFAERTLQGVDENGAAERIVVWIERRQGAVWAVGRAVDPQYRNSDEPRRDDYIFEGYELEDALEVANGALSDDSRVSAQDGRAESITPFEREEILRKLERWFFGHER
jgi:GAF domain-containing protein